MHCSIRFAVLVSWVALLSASGCSDDESNGGSAALCERFAAKMKACGLLSSGDVRCESADSISCTDRCLVNLSCSDLDHFFCQDGLVPGPDLQQCVADCEASSAFVCEDGESIPGRYVCDSGADCLDGSDERNCPMFACRDGQSVLAGDRCDGSSDCDDGSDEDGCPGFRCGNGESIPADWECDGDEDCFDGEDEIGCVEPAVLTCGQ